MIEKEKDPFIIDIKISGIFHLYAVSESSFDPNVNKRSKNLHNRYNKLNDSIRCIPALMWRRRSC